MKRGRRQRRNTYIIHDCDCDCDKETEVFQPSVGWGNWRQVGKPAGWGDCRRQHKQSEREYFLVTGQTGWQGLLTGEWTKLLRHRQWLYFYLTLFINNTLDLYTCLAQLKQALKIEENICIQNNNAETFLKFHFIYENL